VRILITGNMGYVGPIVVSHLRQRFPAGELLGFDSGLFADCLMTNGPLPETLLDAQYFGDVRDLPDTLLNRLDAVVHLAAVSNDPIGNRFEAATDAINRGASIHLASRAGAAGVRKFVFASSCSVYGAADGNAKRESDPLNPLTAYARSKVATEEALQQMDLGEMAVTCLRFSTACGMSDRLRLDLVLNDFVACAVTCREITVLSDGSPWRPLIDVRDMALAIEWAIVRSEQEGGRMLTINVGSEQGNYRVRDLATAVAALVPGTSVHINTAAPFDARSYRVDFGLFRQLAPDFQPRIDLEQSITALVEGLRSIRFDDVNFRESRRVMRLKAISALIDSGKLAPDLRWGRSHETPVGAVPVIAH
jgi:nucleoside-diphosphate-sugar epimerase